MVFIYKLHTKLTVLNVMPIITYNWLHSFPKLGELENVPSNKKVEPVLSKLN